MTEDNRPKAYVVARIAYAPEAKEWIASYWGHVAEQGGYRPGRDEFTTESMEDCLEILAHFMKNYSEANYVTTVEEYHGNNKPG